MTWRLSLIKAAAFVLSAVCLLAVNGPAVAEDLAGNGEWRSRSGDAMRGAWSATLVRSESEIRGNIELTGSPLFSGGQVTGSMDGDELVLGVIAEGDNEATFRGKLVDGTVSGEWDLPAITDSGTWTGTLRPATSSVGSGG